MNEKIGNLTSLADGSPLAGGMLFLSAPAFADKSMAIRHPIPITLDRDGRVPDILGMDEKEPA